MKHVEPRNMGDMFSEIRTSEPKRRLSCVEPCNRSDMFSELRSGTPKRRLSAVAAPRNRSDTLSGIRAAPRGGLSALKLTGVKYGSDSLTEVKIEDQVKLVVNQGKRRNERRNTGRVCVNIWGPDGSNTKAKLNANKEFPHKEPFSPVSPNSPRSVYNADAKNLTAPGNKVSPKLGQRPMRISTHFKLGQEAARRNSTLNLKLPQEMFDRGEIDECTKMGTLLARVGPPNPRLKKWRKRHYLLSGCTLFCFADSTADRQMNEDDLSGATIDTDGNNTQEFAFTLKLKNKAIVELAAETTNDKSSWIAALEVEIQLPAKDEMVIAAAENPSSEELGVMENPMAQKKLKEVKQMVRVDANDRLIMLVNSLGSKEEVGQQEQLQKQLDELGMSLELIDGSSFVANEQKLRNNLFVVSGKHAVYPQLFVFHTGGKRSLRRERPSSRDRERAAINLCCKPCLIISVFVVRRSDPVRRRLQAGSGAERVWVSENRCARGVCGGWVDRRPAGM
jgi:hypothetical protein